MTEKKDICENQRKALQVLLDKRHADMTQRRNVEWRALFGFLTLIVATGAGVLRAPQNFEEGGAGLLIAFISLSAGVVIAFLL